MEHGKKENKNFKVGERGLPYFEIEIGMQVKTPKGNGIIHSIIEDIHCSVNVTMEDGHLENFMYPTVINNEFVWQLEPCDE